jgi:hypothetical protein
MAVDKTVRTLTNTKQEYAYGTLREQEYAYGTLREQKFRSMPASLKIEEFRSNPINYSVTPATSVTSVFFFLCHAA